MNSIKKFRIAAKLLTLLCALLTTACASQDAADSTAPKKQNYDIAAYYWPAYHPEPRWAELGVFGDGKGEWQNVYEAKPKHKGHDQPRVPLLGYEDESDPAVMAKKIDIATSHGVNVMIFDWYWFDSDCTMRRGEWMEEGGNLYYLRDWGGMLYNDWKQRDNGEWYYFRSWGAAEREQVAPNTTPNHKFRYKLRFMFSPMMIILSISVTPYPEAFLPIGSSAPAVHGRPDDHSLTISDLSPSLTFYS